MNEIVQDGKHSRINGVLKKRIAQLEEELRLTQSTLSRTECENEQLEKDLTRLRSEAHDAIGQWERKASELEKIIAASQKEAAERLVRSQERQEQMAERESQRCTLEQVSLEYSRSIQDLQKMLMEAREDKEAAVARAVDAEKHLAESMQRIAGLEKLLNQVQDSIKSSVEAKRSESSQLDTMRSEIICLSEERDVALANERETALRAEKIYSRMLELKNTNDVLRETVEKLRNSCELQETKRNAFEVLLNEGVAREAATAAELSKCQSTLAELKEQLDKVTLEKCAVEREVVENQKKLTELHSTTQQQMDVITVAERDLREQKAAYEVNRIRVVELEQENQSLQGDVHKLSIQKELLQTELTTSQECYTSALREFSEYKRESSQRVQALQMELESLHEKLNELTGSADRKYEATINSLAHVTATFFAEQVRTFVQSESTGRHEVMQLYWCSLFHVREASAKSLAGVNRAMVGQINRSEAQLKILCGENESLKMANHSLEIRCRNSEDRLMEHLKLCASLEARLSEAVARNAVVERLKDEVDGDNAWLKEQVDAMRAELSEVDVILNTNLNDMREENERQQLDNETLRTNLRDKEKSEVEHLTYIQELEKRLTALDDLAALQKALRLTESDLQSLKEEFKCAQVVQKRSADQLAHAQNELSELRMVNTSLMSQTTVLRDQLCNQEEKHRLIIAEKTKEMEALRQKVNEQVERCEKYEHSMNELQQKQGEADHSTASLKESTKKMRSVIDELRGRCHTDGESIRQLIAERDTLAQDRDLIVERYNKLHDTFRNVRRGAFAKVKSEFERVVGLCSEQEKELQDIRHQNTLLKKSITMFASTVQPKAEVVFAERLNLMEGPLRHPKKRALRESDDQH